MRKKWEQQMPLMPPKIDHPQADELEAISRIINNKPTICDHLMQDLCKGRPTVRTGAQGMSADQVLRAAIVKLLFGFTYKGGDLISRSNYYCGRRISRENRFH